jgi:hypothetical protein
MNRRPHRLAVLLAVPTLTLAACSSGDDETPSVAIDVPETVALGVLPDPLTDQPTLPPPPSPPTTAAATPATEPATEPPTPGTVAVPIGGAVAGDRVLLIGDGTLLSAAPPNDSRMCDSLTLFGWDAELDAVDGDDLTFVGEVLDARLAPDDDLDWDVVALFIGNQLPPDGLAVDELEEVLADTIERVAPRPVLLFTLSETDRSREQLNEVIRAQPDEHPNVLVIDWAELGGAAAEVVADDGYSLTDDGLKRLPLQTASVLGEAPVDQDGRCLQPAFPGDDD